VKVLSMSFDGSETLTNFLTFSWIFVGDDEKVESGYKVFFIILGFFRGCENV
jgi:hypothetical protein